MFSKTSFDNDDLACLFLNTSNRRCSDALWHPTTVRSKIIKNTKQYHALKPLPQTINALRSSSGAYWLPVQGHVTFPWPSSRSLSTAFDEYTYLINKGAGVKILHQPQAQINKGAGVKILHQPQAPTCDRQTQVFWNLPIGQHHWRIWIVHDFPCHWAYELWVHVLSVGQAFGKFLESWQVQWIFPAASRLQRQGEIKKSSSSSSSSPSSSHHHHHEVNCTSSH